jgi:Protein of unknown function (DUF4242)
MTSFLVEAYTPGTADLDGIEAAARLAAAELSAAGTPVRYERAIFVPRDELCFHLLDAPSPEIVRDVVDRAGIVPQRVVEAAASDRRDHPPHEHLHSQLN